MDKHVSRTYLTQQIMTASPAKLVAMLYDRAISLLGEAITAIEAGDVERRWKATGKATEVISHLWETLDMEQGGEVAANLGQLYGYIFRILPKIDLDNDPKAAREVIGLLEPLHKSWHELAEKGPETPGKAEEGEAQPPVKGISVSA